MEGGEKLLLSVFRASEGLSKGDGLRVRRKLECSSSSQRPEEQEDGRFQGYIPVLIIKQ